VIVRQKIINIAPGAFSGDQVTRQPGERATGGGGSFSSFNGVLSTNLPLKTYTGVGTGIPYGWEAYAGNHDGVTRQLVISVICASP
jgi:hypothetical protein